MSDWNNLLNSINKKVIGIINSNNDSFSGDGIYKNKDNLTRLLASAKNNGIDFIDVGCVSTKPNFKDVSQEEEFKCFCHNCKIFRYEIRSLRGRVYDSKGISIG